MGLQLKTTVGVVFVLPHTRRLQPNSTKNSTNSTDFESRLKSLGPLGPQVTHKEAPNKLYSIFTQDCSSSRNF